MCRFHMVVLAGVKVGGIAKNSTFSLFWSMSSKSSSPCDEIVDAAPTNHPVLDAQISLLNDSYRKFRKKQLLGGTFFDLLFFPILDFGVVPPCQSYRRFTIQNSPKMLMNLDAQSW